MHQLAHQVPGFQPAAPAYAARAPRAASAGWDGAWKLAVVLLACLAIRVPEYFSFLRFIKPVVTGSLIGAYLIYKHVPRAQLRQTFRHPSMRWLLRYAALSAFAVPFAFADGAAFKLVANTFPFMILMLVALLLVEPTAARLNQVLAGIVGAVGIAGTMCVLRGAGSGGSGRLGSGASYDPNDLASMVALSLPLAIGLVANSKRRKFKALGLFTALVCLTVLAQSGSRGGMVGLGVGMLVYLLGLKPARFIGMLFVTVAMALGMWKFGPEVFRQRARSMLSLEQDYNTNDEQNGRVAIWKRGIEMAKSNPVLGVGPGNFAWYDGFQGTEAGIARGWYTAHNAYVQAAAELGLPGLTLFVCLLVRAGRDAWPLYRKRSRARSPLVTARPEFLACFMAFASAAIFLSHAFHPLLFGVTCLMAFAGHVARNAGQPGEAQRALQPRGAYPGVAPAAAYPALDAQPRRWGPRRMRGGLA